MAAVTNNIRTKLRWRVSFSTYTSEKESSISIVYEAGWAPEAY